MNTEKRLFMQLAINQSAMMGSIKSLLAANNEPVPHAQEALLECIEATLLLIDTYCAEVA